MQAALFTAIVTSFALDSMADLEEDATTQILRLVVAAYNITSEDLPPSDPPSSIIYVNALWFLSITLSLGASTWAMLCQEWCAVHLRGRHPEDYTEMATKRQRAFEAIKKWKMKTLVISIPVILHLSVFLFLAGLWLRLADKNRVLGLVIGVPAAIIVATYIILTLLPVFTDAPFNTSASELIDSVIRHSKHPPRLPRILWPPILTLLTDVFNSAFPSKDQFNSHLIIPRVSSFFRRKYHNAKWTFRRLTFLAISALKSIYKSSAPSVLPLWWGFLGFLPRFEFEEDGPLEELNWLNIGRPEQHLEWRARALFWLLQMPLNQREVREVVQELDEITSGSDSYTLDPQFVKPLALCLSSVLSDGFISPDERLVTIHCMRVLARALDDAFYASESRELIILKNDAVSAALSPLFTDQAPSSVDDKLEWEDMVTSLWFCPTQARIEIVVGRLDRGICGIDEDLLMSTVHGLHAATLNWFRSQKSIEELPIPDILSWDRETRSKDLDGEILAYLRDLFGALCESFHSPKKTAPLPTLIIESIRLLDDNEYLSPTLLNALCSFIIVGWRVTPGSLDTDPSVADALLESVEMQSQSVPITEGTLVRLAYKLDAIAYGPAVMVERDYLPLTKLESVFYQVTHQLDGDAEGSTVFVQRFLDAYTSTMENMFSLDGYARNVTRYSDTDVMSSMNVLLDPNIFRLAQANIKYRLPFLYSLAIAFTYASEVRPVVETLSRVGELFITTEGDRDHVELAMDTNFFAALVLGRVMGHRHLDDSEAGVLLGWLQRNLLVGGDRIRWKGIYLLTELANIIDDIQSRPECTAIKQSLENIRNQRKAAGKPFADSDWNQRREGFRLCGLEPVMKSSLGSLDRGVYDWKDGIPLLLLYPQYSSLDPEDQAVYRFLSNLQRLAFFHQGSSRLFVVDAPCSSESLLTGPPKQTRHLQEVCRNRGRNVHPLLRPAKVNSLPRLLCSRPGECSLLHLFSKILEATCRKTSKFLVIILIVVARRTVCIDFEDLKYVQRNPEF